MKFKIGKRVFNIKFEDKINDSDDWGLITHSKCLIQIKNTNELEKRVTLLHEMIHAILRSIGYNDHDESLVGGIAERLYEALQDNPEIFKYLMKKTK